MINDSVIENGVKQEMNSSIEEIENSDEVKNKLKRKLPDDQNLSELLTGSVLIPYSK